MASVVVCANWESIVDYLPGTCVDGMCVYKATIPTICFNRFSCVATHVATAAGPAQFPAEARFRWGAPGGRSAAAHGHLRERGLVQSLVSTERPTVGPWTNVPRMES